MLQRTLIALLATLLLLAGCDKHAEEKAALNQIYEKFDNANNNSDGAFVVGLFTDETFHFYQQLLPIALNAPQLKVRSLPSAEMHEVLLMRTYGTRKDLENLDGRAYVEFATSKGWYCTRPQNRTTDILHRFKFGNDWATAELYSDGEALDIKYRFEKIDGAWKIDERVTFTSLSEFMDKIAAEVGMSRHEFVVLALEEHIGRPVPDSVWQPMK